MTLHQRTDFAASMIDGRTVMELPNRARSAQEITDLWDYLADRLSRVEPQSFGLAPPAAHPTARPAIRAIQGSLAQKLETAG